jgi:hypothetical protein
VKNTHNNNNVSRADNFFYSTDFEDKSVKDLKTCCTKRQSGLNSTFRFYVSLADEDPQAVSSQAHTVKGDF